MSVVASSVSAEDGISRTTGCLIAQVADVRRERRAIGRVTKRRSPDDGKQRRASAAQAQRFRDSADAGFDGTPVCCDAVPCISCRSGSGATAYSAASQQRAGAGAPTAAPAAVAACSASAFRAASRRRTRTARCACIARGAVIPISAARAEQSGASPPGNERRQPGSTGVLDAVSHMWAPSPISHEARDGAGTVVLVTERAVRQPEQVEDRD